MLGAPMGGGNRGLHARAQPNQPIGPAASRLGSAAATDGSAAHQAVLSQGTAAAPDIGASNAQTGRAEHNRAGVAEPRASNEEPTGRGACAAANGADAPRGASAETAEAQVPPAAPGVIGVAAGVGQAEREQARVGDAVTGDHRRLPPHYERADRLLAQPIPPREFLWGPWLERRVVTALIAQPGVGKTTLLASAVIAMAAGMTWAGQAVPHPLRTVWVNLEENGDERRRRLAAAARHLGQLRPDVLERILVWTAGPMSLLERQQGEPPKLTQAFLNLKDALVLHGADAVIVDPVVFAHGLDENNNLEMTLLLGAFNAIARDHNCAVAFAHHTKKEGATKISLESARGATALGASARNVLGLVHVTEAKDTPGSDQSPAQRVMLLCLKSNNASTSQGSVTFERSMINLLNGARDAASDEVGVLTPV
jgi:hypothetical protein